MVLKALEKLGVPKEEALYVGDMEVDIETGRRAGIETWVMPTGSHDEATLRAAGVRPVVPGHERGHCRGDGPTHDPWRRSPLP